MLVEDETIATIVDGGAGDGFAVCGVIDMAGDWGELHLWAGG